MEDQSSDSGTLAKTLVTKITSNKPKDPKRVAQSKRLAEISRAARERKMRERVVAEQQQNITWSRVALVAAVIGATGYPAYTTIYHKKTWQSGTISGAP